MTVDVEAKAKERAVLAIKDVLAARPSGSFRAQREIA
jgi:hypothetical protein